MRRLLIYCLAIAILLITPIGWNRSFSYAHVPHLSSAESVCSRTDILFCQDWEGISDESPAGRRAEGWDWEDKFATGYDILNTGGYLSTNALNLYLPQDAGDTIYPAHRIDPQQGTLYFRFDIKYSPGYIFNNGQQKIAYLRALNGEGMAWRIEIANRGRSDRTKAYFFVDLNVHNLYLVYNQGIDLVVEGGQWYRLELMVKLNAPGASNGEIKLWVDGILVVDNSGLDMRQGAGDPATPINDVWITSYYGGPTASHPTQTIWYDNLVVSTNPIGPFGQSLPAAPTDLKVD